MLPPTTFVTITNQKCQLYQKYWKITLVSLAIIIALLFANGCYYVFNGQHKSMKKLQQGKELNLYECCSIYSMHTAIWMFGWIVSPEAAEQAFLMCFPVKYVTRYNDFFLDKEKTIRHNLALPSDFEIKQMDDVADLIPMYYCNIDVEYSDITYKVGNLNIQGALLKYIQDKGWLHTFMMTYISG